MECSLHIAVKEKIIIIISGQRGTLVEISPSVCQLKLQCRLASHLNFYDLEPRGQRKGEEEDEGVKMAKEGLQPLCHVALIKNRQR